MLQGAGSGNQRKCHAGFVNEFIECAQFMIPLPEPATRLRAPDAGRTRD
jgi:hypothetical protein